MNSVISNEWEKRIATTINVLGPYTDVKEYDTYLFDLDNTLVDSSHGLEIALRAGFKEFNIPYDHDRYDEYISTPLRETFERYVPNCPCKFRDFFSIVITTYDKCYTDSVEMFPDAKICISELIEKGKRLGVVSNSLTSHINGIFERLDIADCFGSVVGFDRCANGKPDPQPIILCLKELNSDASTAVMIGDSMSDVKAGHRACIDTAFLNRKSREVQCEPTYTITDLREMLTPFHLC